MEELKDWLLVFYSVSLLVETIFIAILYVKFYVLYKEPVDNALITNDTEPQFRGTQAVITYKIDLTELNDRNIIDKLKYYFICRKKGHTVNRSHPKYPSQYCSVCSKHKSEF